jgi:hypothetical protein
VIAVVLSASPVAAHDLENTRVLLAFERDGSFVLDVANDPSWLKLRLERFPGSFADRVVLWVDGHEVRPTSVEFLPGPIVATHRLRGRLPPDARTPVCIRAVIDPTAGDPAPTAASSSKKLLAMRERHDRSDWPVPRAAFDPTIVGPCWRCSVIPVAQPYRCCRHKD